jgi:hypothetical protein
MALRVVLVALVAALGLELPRAEEFASWSRSGRAWVDDRLAELASLSARPEPAGSTPEAAPIRVDLAFEAATEAMASEFVSDLATIAPKPTADASLVSAEPPTEPGPLAGDSRIERITEAVRLTRQAVDAWSSVIHPADPDDRGDSL